MPSLVFLSGASGSASFWAPVAKKLEDLGPVYVSPPSIAHFLADRIAGAQTVIVSGGTHAFASERPEQAASIIRSHLL